MLLKVHVILAMFSIALSTYSVVSPRKLIIRSVYVITGFVLVSGVVLIIRSDHVTTTSIFAGLSYVVVVGLELLYSRGKLAKTSLEP